MLIKINVLFMAVSHHQVSCLHTQHRPLRIKSDSSEILSFNIKILHYAGKYAVLNLPLPGVFGYRHCLVGLFAMRMSVKKFNGLASSSLNR